MNCKLPFNQDGPLPSEKYVIQATETLAGDGWRKLYPRIYANAPLGYCSPKLPSAMFLSSAAEPPDKHQFDRPIVAKLMRYFMPTIWLDKKLVAAMKETVPPDTYDLLDLPLPLPAMTIMLPEGTIKSRDGDVRFISYARYEASEINDKVQEPHIFVLSGASNFTIQSLSMSPRSSKLNLGDLDSFMAKLGVITDDTGQGTDDERNKQALFYLLSTILIITARPELETKGTLLNRVQKKGKEPREFWSPHWLGKSYAVRTEEPVGSHQSPRLHWVRGFYRNQPIGPRNEAKRILKWIEPFLRGV